MTSNTAGYLSSNEWLEFDDQLTTARLIFNELAKTLRYCEIRDSRWPSTGLQNRRWFRQWRLKLTLNPEYLSNHKVYYELAIHDCIYIPVIMFYRSISYRVVKTYLPHEIADKERLLLDIEDIIQKLK